MLIFLFLFLSYAFAATKSIAVLEFRGMNIGENIIQLLFFEHFVGRPFGWL